jgi:predicted Zn-dependent protease
MSETAARIRPNSRRRSHVAFAGLWLTTVALVASCAMSPTGRRQLKLFPDDQMSAMGVESFESLKQQQPVSQNAAAVQYVTCVSNALLAELDPAWRDGWEIVVFEDRSANAFALPGRKIGVHTGLLSVAKTQDQLAAVIGHEIGHVMADHGNERVSQQSALQIGMQTVAVMTDTTTATGQATMAALGIGSEYGVLLPFSRSHESEADEIGLDLMARAGFDPAQSVTLWENMSAAGGQQPPEWMSTHPSHDTRISALRAGVPEANIKRDAARKAGRAPRCAVAG